MKPTTVRGALPSDSRLYFEWLYAASDINLVDTKVYGYPGCTTLVVEQDGVPALMNSFHPVIMMEALAPRPGIAPRDEAMALRRLYESIRQGALAVGIAEVWFSCIDESLHRYIERKGFVRVNTPIFKMVLGGESDPLNQRRPEGLKEALSAPLTEEHT